MTFSQFIKYARDKENFKSVEDYVEFAGKMLSAQAGFVKAEIICQNETNYRFWQLPEETGYAISRPINATLLCTEQDLNEFIRDVIGNLHRRAFMESLSPEYRSRLASIIYTVQQMIVLRLTVYPRMQVTLQES